MLSPIQTLTILLADDDPDFLDEFADYFRHSKLDQQSFEIVALCTNGDEALAELGKHQPQLALLDIDMPGFNGIEVARQAKILSPNSKIMIWSCYPSYTGFQELAQAGVKSYLVKPFAFSALEVALRTVLQGDVWFDPLMTRHTYKKLLDSTNEAHSIPHFTESEKVFLRLIQQGLEQSDIAIKLNMNINTVKSRIQTIREKANCKNLKELLLQMHKFL